MSYLYMRQKGAWWKGLTADNMEVAISDDFFKKIRAKQEQSAREHPLLAARIMEHYDGMMGCYHPQWWVDGFLKIHDGIGLQKHTWVRKKGYDKAMLGEVTTRGYGSNEVGSEGTLIFRQLSPKKAQQLRDWEQEMGAMREAVESLFTKELGIPIRWE